MKRLSWAILCVLTVCTGCSKPVHIRHTDVFTSGRDGYQAYRIPAIETAPDGSLLAFAEGRKHNRSDPGMESNDIDLVMKRSTDGGATWSGMRVIEDPGELWSAANPATVVDKARGRLWLFYLRSRPGRSTVTSRPGTDDMQTMARTSDDSGRTWSEPFDLTGVARDMTDPNWGASVVGPGGAIQTRKGGLLAPVWGGGGLFAIFSEDNGRTWRRGKPLAEVQGTEPQLVELNDGRVLMDIRQAGGSRLRRMAFSNDSGATWSAVRNGLTVSAVACAIERYTSASAGDDRDRIVWTGPRGEGRRNLVIRVSYDEGRTFPLERAVAEGHAAYSDLTITRDKSVGILWERGADKAYEFVTFTRLTREFLEPAR